MDNINIERQRQRIFYFLSEHAMDRYSLEMLEDFADYLDLSYRQRSSAEDLEELGWFNEDLERPLSQLKMRNV